MPKPFLITKVKEIEFDLSEINDYEKINYIFTQKYQYDATSIIIKSKE
jgi:hypothetical protein